MKKAKIALSSIALVAVVSGALAFKAHSFNGKLFCRAGSPGACITTTSYNINAAAGTLYCTEISANTTECSVTTHASLAN